MNGVLRRIPAADLPRVRKDDDYRQELFASAWGAGFNVPLADSLSRLPWYFRWTLKLLLRKQFKAAAAAQAQQLTDPARAKILDLHKSWHGLHWLLCQSAWEGPEPLRNAILGGEEVGDDLGYGPARLVQPETVREVADALALLSASQVMKRYDAKAMDAAEIYPGGFVEDSSWRNDFKHDFERLKSFYADAAKDGEAVVAWLS